MAVKPIPDGYATVTPYLYVRDAARAIDFYSKAFGAIELYRLANPDGRIGHAEILIGTSRIMLADEFPEMNVKGPQSLEGTSVPKSGVSSSFLSTSGVSRNPVSVHHSCPKRCSLGSDRFRIFSRRNSKSV